MDWILVAAINPHNPVSWGYTHIVDGTARLLTLDKQAGAQVIPGFVPLLVAKKIFKLVNWQKLFGIEPVIRHSKII